jgi:hypothetical protein
MRYYKIFEKTKFHHQDTEDRKKNGLTTNGRELTRIKNEICTRADTVRTVIDQLGDSSSRQFASIRG